MSGDNFADDPSRKFLEDLKKINSKQVDVGVDDGAHDLIQRAVVLNKKSREGEQTNGKTTTDVVAGGMTQTDWDDFADWMDKLKVSKLFERINCISK